jgi:putative spermidine/putrescine transport system substrate-binding protein
MAAEESLRSMKKIRKRDAVSHPAIRPMKRPVLRVLGTEITQLGQIRRRAEDDLGIEVIFETLDFQSAQRKAATEPDSYDVYDQCFHNIDIVWFWRAVQSIDLERITRWDEVSDLTKTGRLTPGARIGRGDAPVSKLYVQANGSLGPSPTAQISMLPTVHNLDAFAYLPEVRNGDQDIQSWGALLDERWKGKAAIVDEPAIGIFDLALAAQARGEISFADIGDMTTGEIDRLVDLVIAKKRAGHFSGFWKTARDAADLMGSGETVIESMWSPGFSALRSRGVPVSEAAPSEGYRAWHGGLCLSRKLSGRLEDVAYDYLNWWLEGWAGAVMARQGYYMSVPSRVQHHLGSDEWDYWYQGLPARNALPGPDGTTTIAAGEVRSGGSYLQRASSIAVWNTTMDEHNYLTRRWGELVAGGG